MSPKIFLAVMVLVIFAGLVVVDRRQAQAGEVVSTSEYKVLEGIRHGNLTVFPVVAAKTYSTGEFLTLDEGLHSGEVIVTESGNLRGLVRPHSRPGVRNEVQSGGAQVNKLVLINQSKRPLILLAGEIVTGGKQDRVIGKDRIIPAQSDPVDLSVFCVEPGRWVATSQNFGASGAMYGSAGKSVSAPMTMMAQPSVRAKAMGDKDQEQVWAEVRKQREAVSFELAPSAPQTATVIGGTTSYAKVMETDEVKQRVDAIAVPLEHNYQTVIKQLRDSKAVGIVVAVNGRFIWADVFANTELLEKYWPKLVRSYASEAVVTHSRDREATQKGAQVFLDAMEGRHESIENEPGLYRHTEINGDGFKAFALTSLLPKTGFDVHVAKMAD